MPEIENVQERHPASMEALRANGVAGRVGSYVGTVALVGLGVALIEEELLAGMAIGVAAMAFPALVPRMGAALRPLLKSAVRAGYGVAARTRETVAEMSEQFQDVVAEVRAEHQHEPGAAGDGTGAHETAPRAEASTPVTEPETGRARRSRGNTPSTEQTE